MQTKNVNTQPLDPHLVSASPPKTSVPVSGEAATVKPVAFHIARALTAEGWTDTPKAQRHVAEWSIHQAVNLTLRTLVPVLIEGKQVNLRPLSAGELLDVVQKTLPSLPGQAMAQPLKELVVPRPAGRKSSDGNSTVSSVRPARAAAVQRLSRLGLHDDKTVKRFMEWALLKGFEQFTQLPQDLRKLVLSGKGVHPNAVIQVIPPKPQAP